MYVGDVKPSPDAPHTLLTTVTGEAFQPVRLYYAVPNKAVVTKLFARLRCIDEDSRGRCWVWLYRDEAESLAFPRPRSELPADVHPIVIGRFRFPDKTRMTLEVRSADRAVEAAKFFAPLLGPSVVLGRLRVVNRWFAAEEATAGLDRLDKLLDANVVRIDPPKTKLTPRRPQKPSADRSPVRRVRTRRRRRSQPKWRGSSARTCRSSRISRSTPTRRRPTSAT